MEEAEADIEPSFRPPVNEPWAGEHADIDRSRELWVASMKRRRTTMGTLIDHDKLTAYEDVKMLFTVRWLDRS